MTKAQKSFEKVAVIAVTPWKVRSKKELESGKGWFKEYGNRTVSGFLGLVPGAALAGAGAIAGGKAKIPLIAAGGALGLAGGVTSDIRATRKTEREAGVEPMGVGKYFGRYFGSAGGGMIAPVVGIPIGDYLVSRKMQTYQKAKKVKKASK